MDKILRQLDINNLIKAANEGVYCGAECKRKQKEAELRENVNKAELNMKNAPEDYEKANDEYIKFLHGDTKYKNYKTQRDKRAFLKSIQPQLGEIHKNSNDLKEIQNNNAYLTNTLRILEENIKDENEKIKETEGKLDKLKTKLDTTKQKTEYEEENTKILDSIQKFNNYLFYILLFIALIVYYTKFGLPSIKIAFLFLTLVIYNKIVDYYTL